MFRQFLKVNLNSILYVVTGFASVAALFFLSIQIELFAWWSKQFKKRDIFVGSRAEQAGTFEFVLIFQLLKNSRQIENLPPSRLNCWPASKPGIFSRLFPDYIPPWIDVWIYFIVYVLTVSRGRYFHNSWRYSTTERRRQRWHKYPKKVWLKYQFLPSQRKYEQAKPYVYQRTLVL